MLAIAQNKREDAFAHTPLTRLGRVPLRVTQIELKLAVANLNISTYHRFIMEADKPFDSTTLGDIILISSDDIHFYVLEAFLSYVSPTFRDMKFSLSRGSLAEKNEMKDGYPVVPLPEDRESITCLSA